MPASPIAPGIFDLLTEWANKATAETDIDRAIRGASPVLTFCENFYLQFFENVLHQEITSIDMNAKRVAVRSRRNAKRAGDPGKIIPLITWFEKLADMYPDVQALGYDAPLPRYRDFYTSYMVTLLTRIVAWTQTLSAFQEMKESAQASLTAFETALERMSE